MENTLEKEYDFFTMGIRRATDLYSDLTKTAQSIGEQYGEQAKLEFECGVAVALSSSVNERINDIQQIVSKSSGVHASKM